MEQIDVDKVKRTIDHSAKAMQVSGILAVVTVIATLIAIIFLLASILNAQQANLKEAIRTSELQHQKTQQYVRCISLLPLNERTPEDFDKCSISGDVVTDPNQTVK